MPFTDPVKRREYERKRNIRRREYFRARYWKDPEKARKSGREYWAANPEATAARNRIRVERKRAARKKYGSLVRYGLSEIDSEAMLALKTHCGLCGETKAKFHLDHVIPKSRGGSNNRENLQWLCATCNIAKGALTPDEFIAHIRKILGRLQ